MNKNSVEKKEAVLVFHKDEHGNFVSRLNNGKIVLHHRKDTVDIIEGLEYNCLIEEKPHWCFAWIKGLVYYPRIIVKADKECIVVENPKTRKLFPNIYEALKNIQTKIKKRYVLLVLTENNKAIKKVKEK